jgi:S-formylglutathione hydrolase FrmB
VLELAASEAADSTGVDSTALILQELLVDQGSTDNFLTGDVDQLQPTRLAEACAAKGISLNLRMQEGACVSGHVGSSSHCSRCTLGEMPLATRRTDFLTHVRACVGYDHSYFFISTFIEDHVNFHADALAK